MDDKLSLVPKEKRCFLCRKIKPIKEFHKHSGSYDRHQSLCKECRRETTRKAYDKWLKRDF